jgi:hypothetical protein
MLTKSAPASGRGLRLPASISGDYSLKPPSGRNVTRPAQVLGANSTVTGSGPASIVHAARYPDWGADGRLAATWADDSSAMCIARAETMGNRSTAVLH